MSYLAALIPFVIRGRSGVPAGPFNMSGITGWVVNLLACGYMTVWIFFYCFPYTKEFTLESMNWSSLMVGGLTVLVGIWWLCIQRRYKGPAILGLL